MATESTKELKKRVNSKNKKSNKNVSSSKKKKNNNQVVKKNNNNVVNKPNNKKNNTNNKKKKYYKKKQTVKKIPTPKIIEIPDEIPVKEEVVINNVEPVEKVEPVIEEFLPTQDLSMTVPTLYLDQVKEKIQEVLEENVGSNVTIVEPKIKVENIVIVQDDKKKKDDYEITQEELDELIKPQEKEEVYIDYELSKKIIIVLLMSLLLLSVGTIVLFMNLNVIDRSKDYISVKTNLEVTYEIGEINDQKKVVITIHCKSNAGLKRIILPSGKVNYLDGVAQDIEYSVAKNGSYIFSVSDKDNNVNQINVNVDKFN